MRNARGFSLIEVLLAATLLAAGMALAFTSLRSAGESTARAEAMAQRSERLRAVQAFMRRQLGDALPLAARRDAGNGREYPFIAATDSVTFVAPMPGYLSRGGPYVQTFRLVRGNGGMQLEFEHRLLTPDGPIDPERPPEVLLEGIRRGGFDVRAIGDNGEPTPWAPRWEEANRLPRLVRLQLELEDPRATWPELVVAPRAGASVQIDSEVLVPRVTQ